MGALAPSPGAMLSGAETLGSIGALAATLALAAGLADRRRAKRANLDEVGFMPWTAIFFLGLFTACVTLGLAARLWVAG